jgi:hypothetical protein
VCGRHIITISFSYAKEGTLTFLWLECLSTMRRTLSSLLCFVNDEKCFSYCKNTSPDSHLISWTIPNVPIGVLSMSLPPPRVCRGKSKLEEYNVHTDSHRRQKSHVSLCLHLSKDPPVVFQFVQISFVLSERWINWNHSHRVF